jgi:hypothetical protein
VLIVADSVEAIQHGDYQLVLGELHLAMNTLGASLFVNQHPNADTLLAETNRDFPHPRLMPMLPKEQPPRWSARSRPALVRPEDYYVALVDHTVDPRRPRTVPSADVTVEPGPDGLHVILPDGATFDAVDVFAHVLTTLAIDLFGVLPESVHSPRVTVDRMVIARETWQFPAQDLPFAHQKDEARRYVQARWWRTQHNLPRFAFAISPTEPRPFYIDFDSPIYINILAKAIRRLTRTNPTATLTITEMLPTPHQTWLTDDHHNTYTSELRFVAVDLTRTAGPVR